MKLEISHKRMEKVMMMMKSSMMIPTFGETTMTSTEMMMDGEILFQANHQTKKEMVKEKVKHKKPTNQSDHSITTTSTMMVDRKSVV